MSMRRHITIPAISAGYDIRSLLDELTVYIVPMVNPDGVNLVQNGVDSVQDPEKVKSMRMLQDGYEEWKANINGVDLNRQYPCHWDEKASNTDVPSSEMYKGEAPATEPEVQAMMALCEGNDFVLAASFHTKGEVIYWADSGTEQEIPADNAIAQTLAGVTGYSLMPVSEDPATYGAGFENWFRQEVRNARFLHRTDSIHRRQRSARRQPVFGVDLEQGKLPLRRVDGAGGAASAIA